MLRIRAEQVDSLDLSMVRATAPDLVRDFRERLRAAVPASDEWLLTAIVEDALVRAWRYGLRATTDLRAFAQLAWSVSPRFDAHPRFAAIFADPAVAPADKMKRLWDSATPDDWLAAAALAR